MSLNLNIARDEFLNGLGILQNVTGKKGTIAILSNVLIESGSDNVTLIGTDLEVGIKITLPAEILTPGSITLPAKKLFEIIRESDAEMIRLQENDKQWVKITADVCDYNLAGMNGEEFPAFPEYDEASLVNLVSEDLRELIDKSIFSVAPEGDSQFNLSGILVERHQVDGANNLRMVTSDGHRLTVMDKQIEQDLSALNMENTVLIPKKGMQEIRKVCENSDEIAICFEKNQAVIKTDNTVMVIRLMNGDFPDYNNILNIVNKDNFIEIKKVSLTHSMKRMNLFTEDRFNAVKFFIDNNILILSSETMDIGNAKDQINIDYSGEPLNLGFNGKYFVEALNVMNSEIVKVYINSEESPCLISGDEDPGYLAVIMPMKL